MIAPAAPILRWLLVASLIAVAAAGFRGPAAEARALAAVQVAPPAPAPLAPLAPMSWRAEIAASFRQPFERLLRSFVRFLPRLLATVLSLLVVWGISLLVRRLTRRLSRVLPDSTLRQVLEQFSYYAVWGIGVAIALDTLGFDAQAVITGFGLTSIALGFALKDVLSNLVSGMLILLTRSFALNDQIIVGETEGTVERIEVRTTHIRTYDGRLVLVPNAEVFTSRVVNNTASPLRRASIIVPLDYRQDLAAAIRAMEEAINRTAGVAADPPMSVRVRDFFVDHLALEARFWTDARRTDFMNTSCNVRAAILQTFKAAGVQMPSLDGRTLSPGDPERWRAVFAGKAESGF